MSYCAIMLYGCYKRHNFSLSGCTLALIATAEKAYGKGHFGSALYETAGSDLRNGLFRLAKRPGWTRKTARMASQNGPFRRPEPALRETHC